MCHTMHAMQLALFWCRHERCALVICNPAIVRIGIGQSQLGLDDILHGVCAGNTNQA